MTPQSTNRTKEPGCKGARDQRKNRLCWIAEQIHQKVNNGLGLYSPENGLMKRNALPGTHEKLPEYLSIVPPVGVF